MVWHTESFVWNDVRHVGAEIDARYQQSIIKSAIEI
jgi:hypothetical protein